ncbi:hypothetical protein Droror1_Dr00003508 [Drosera rotundifolia]
MRLAINDPQHFAIANLQDRPAFWPEPDIHGQPCKCRAHAKDQIFYLSEGRVFQVNTRGSSWSWHFIVDGNEWKAQRQIASHEFNTKLVRKFIKDVVDTELNNRLIPILSEAAKNGTVLDLQDILKRFGVDNICQIAFGYDPECLTPSIPEVEFAVAHDEALENIGQRFNSLTPLQWKIKKYLNIGSEKRFKEANSLVRKFARTVVRDKKDLGDALPADSDRLVV